MNQSSHKNRSDVRIAFVQARWHADIVDQCRLAFLDEIDRLTNGNAGLDVFDVPGAMEIPLTARDLARSGRYDAIVGAALVANGGIYRHDFVAQAVIDGLMRAQMDTDVPILSAVLTPHHFHETEPHRTFFLDHFKIKGREVAEACMGVLAVRNTIAPAA